MLPAITLDLSDRRVYDTLQNVLWRRRGLKVLDQVESLVMLSSTKMMDHKVEPCLRGDSSERREHLKGAFSPTKHNLIVSKQVIVHIGPTRPRVILQRSKLSLCSLPVLESKLIARLEVHRKRTVGMRREIHREDLQTDIEVVEFTVAKRNVDVQGEVILVLQQETLVDVGRLLKVTAQVVDGCKGELVLDAVAELLMIVH